MALYDVDIRPQLDQVSPDIANPQSSRLDEDDSTLSSASSDRSVRSVESTTASKGKWKANINGDWRYGSSESATSTAMSSVSSSTAAEDKTITRPQFTSPLKKRMSDGSIKQPPLRLNSSIGSASEQPQAVPEQPQQDQQTQHIPPKKKRGRPPKDKSLLAQPAPKAPKASRISELKDEVRPRSSIPSRLPAEVHASQAIEAAYASRLNPFELHRGEHSLLADLLMSHEVTVYLNIRNAILRLWHQNPLCGVTPKEAAGCAKEARFFGLAEAAYKWLVRNGYINFGCVETPRDAGIAKSRRSGKQKTVVVVGAGVSGLTTARQLEHLFEHDAKRWTDVGERPPKVIVLEGRKRIGGRVYSKQLRDQVPGSLPDDLRNTVEMGAMIVTGFEHGNPLDTIIRGQLGLRYHLMKDALTIYDSDGRPVDEQRDMLNTELYADISDRAGDFRAAPQDTNTLKGDEELISRCRDPISDGFADFQLEPLPNPMDHLPQYKPAAKRGRRRNAPPQTEKLTGRTRVIEMSNATQSAARAAKEMGWQLREGIARNQSISLNEMARASSHPTLGSVMDDAIEQYQDLVQLTPQDMRMLNWHHANLEYANAAPVSSLSLSGHDQDTGNEFEGAHSEIIGGYTQLPRGLMNLPTKLDVRFDRVVDSIHYNEGAPGESEYTTKVVCSDGQIIEADQVVMTVPLGVLKDDVVDFDPPLPGWKYGVIQRMGFGLLNKVILLYDQSFWDDDRDMFGLLNDAEQQNSLDPEEYARRRGRFYLIWNASKISGRPALVALMAGHAAHDAETTDSNSLLAEINDRLRTVFSPEKVTAPSEVIVTRWKRDPFTRGTYSYVGPRTRSGDYDLMAKPVGNLHFAGEATCGTHPATVHGAFLSGLRVASDVMTAMTGPIDLPLPLVGAPTIKQETVARYNMPQTVPLPPQPSISTNTPATAQVNAPIIKQEHDPTSLASVPVYASAPAPPPPKLAGPPKQSVCARDDSFWARPSFDHNDLDYEASIVGTILSRLGDRPLKPSRPGVNPFLLFTKAKWDECKAHCSRDASTAGRDAIRATLGKWWKAATEEEKRPYLEQSEQAQKVADTQRKEWAEGVEKWDAEARRIRQEFVAEHPPPVVQGEGVGGSKRKSNNSSWVVLDHV
ncbi:uncharacterized protein LTR77_003969 [Saxophila tyrrhenica]|uniref:SWIRM domain-containing protein n=1 Tax=Saxophila tyrrhenica TaxID=1690608 RepID=A0AAV9PI56_9PEZI|nr:hypothetical protein LTR77_003969 [Saxophila tyrrhenica]